MSNRYKVIMTIGVALLLLIGIISNITFISDFLLIMSDETWHSSDDIAIHIVIDNQTNEQIGPFVVSNRSGDGSPLYVNNIIEPLSKLDVYYYVKSSPNGDNQIIMTDSNNDRYAIMGYFEYGLKGRVDIRIECVSPDGLSGKIRRAVSWLLLSLEWYPLDKSVCK